jgi:glycosyltransferase involved in cell wall biosynthesis
MEKPPRAISVLLSVRNGLPFVEQTVASILAQTFLDFEFVIVDNCSTDGSRDYLQQVAKTDPRIRLILNERDLGHSGGLNRGLEVCSAEWIARIDADDVALPNRLERQLAFVRQHPQVKVTSSLAYYINEKGQRKGKTVLELTTEKKFHDYMARNEVIGLLHPCVMMRKDVVLEAGGYREEYKGANDIDLWNRISERGHLILVQPEILMEYRIHSASISVGKFKEIRLKYEWVRACMTARRSGRAEPDWETFLLEWNNVSVWARINRQRKTLAKMYYRLGGENFIANKRIKGAGYFALSALLQPGYALRRLTGQVLVKGTAGATAATLGFSGKLKTPAAAPLPVTIIICCHNAAPFIRQAIESCLNQNRPAQKLVVIDDASTDGSVAVMDQYTRAGAMELIQNRHRQGRAISVNRAFETVKTKYIALLDADDVAMPGRFERQVEFMEAHPRIGCSSSFVRYINTVGTRIASGVLSLLTERDLENHLSAGEPIGLFAPAVILRAEVVKNPALRFRAAFWPADDIDLWNRIAEAGWQVLAQPEFLTAYRIHSSSIVTTDARNTRLQYEWVRACLRARRRGLREPAHDEFQRQLEAMPLTAKLNRERKVEAKVSCRAAGFALGERRFIRATLHLAKAFCLQPGYVSRRLAQQIFKS